MTTDYDYNQMGFSGNDGALQSFQAEYEANMIGPNQSMNARSENVHPTEHMPLYDNNSLFSMQYDTISSVLFPSFLIESYLISFIMIGLIMGVHSMNL